MIYLKRPYSCLQQIQCVFTYFVLSCECFYKVFSSNITEDRIVSYNIKNTFDSSLFSNKIDTYKIIWYKLFLKWITFCLLNWSSSYEIKFFLYLIYSVPTYQSNAEELFWCLEQRTLSHSNRTTFSMCCIETSLYVDFIMSLLSTLYKSNIHRYIHPHYKVLGKIFNCIILQQISEGKEECGYRGGWRGGGGKIALYYYHPHLSNNKLNFVRGGELLNLVIKFPDEIWIVRKVFNFLLSSPSPLRRCLHIIQDYRQSFCNFFLRIFIFFLSFY